MCRNRLFNSLKRAPKESDRFVEARSLYGFAFHVYDNTNKVALCGYSQPIVNKTVITQEKMVASLPHQHKGWYWCSECVYQFTGEKMIFLLNI